MYFLRRRDADPVSESLSAGLRDAYAVSVPDLKVDLETAELASPARATQHALTLRRAAFATGAVAVVAAALLVLPALFGGGTKAVTAEEIVNRAQQAATRNATANGRPYHLVAVTDLSGKIPGGSSRTETWSLDPTHVRTETTDPAAVFGTIQDGSHFWMYMTADAGLRVVHVADIGAEAAGRGGAGVLSFADYLTSASVKDCQSRVQEGTETLDGRDAYVVRLVPDPNNCPDSKRLAVGGLGYTRVWVDRETFVALRMEQVAPDGTVGYSYRVIEFQVGGPIAPSVFAYDPPAGATVVEASNLAESKAALAGDKSYKSAGKSESGPEKPADGDRTVKP
jgi:outer membrane lipoprotein-sorting protein